MCARVLQLVTVHLRSRSFLLLLIFTSLISLDPTFFPIHWSDTNRSGGTSMRRLVRLEWNGALISVIGKSWAHPIISSQTDWVFSWHWGNDRAGAGCWSWFEVSKSQVSKLPMAAARARSIKRGVFYESNTSTRWKIISRTGLEMRSAEVPTLHETASEISGILSSHSYISA